MATLTDEEILFPAISCENVFVKVAFSKEMGFAVERIPNEPGKLNVVILSGGIRSFVRSVEGVRLEGAVTNFVKDESRVLKKVFDNSDYISRYNLLSDLCQKVRIFIEG